MKKIQVRQLPDLVRPALHLYIFKTWRSPWRIDEFLLLQGCILGLFFIIENAFLSKQEKVANPEKSHIEIKKDQNHSKLTLQ